MGRISIFLGLIGLCVGQLGAQNSQRDQCGSSAADNALIKQRLLQNRANRGLGQTKSSSTIYIPITFHLVGDGNGQNFPDPEGAIASLCALNEDFLSQNIQFYLNFPIRYFPNQTVYDDGYGGASFGIMGDAKVPNTFNIYIGNNVSRPVAGYYSPGEDYVFIRRGEANRSSNTLTHEAGHFFTLPHTFYGWENENYDDLFGGSPAPTQINGNAVEYAARTGAQANCSSAADAFCDTEADYYSYRVNCGYNSPVFDPDSMRVRAFERYYMSYFGDACMDSFSVEQQQAMLSDMGSRGWLNFPAPSMLAASDSITALYPSVNQLINLDDNNRNIRFEWTAAPGAEAYIVSLERFFFGQSVGFVGSWVVYGDTFFNYDASTIRQRGDYHWSVRPFNRYNTCEAGVQGFDFQIGTLVSNQLLEDKPQDKLQVLGYTQGQLRLKIQTQSERADMLRIYNPQGQLLFQQQQITQAGDNLLNIDFLQLPAGVYLLNYGANSSPFAVGL